MERFEDDKKLEVIGKHYKTLAKNTIYSIFNSYGLFLLSLMTSYLIARMITAPEWGILIIATSIILILSSCAYFFPPGLIFSMNFYIPRYRAKNDDIKLNNFMKKALILQLISVFTFFSIGLIFFLGFYQFFIIYLENHQNLLFILLPLVIIINLDAFAVSSFLGFNLFKLNLVSLVIRALTNVIPLLIIFLTTRTIEIETIALINLFTALLPLVFKLIVLFYIFPRKQKNTAENPKLSYKQFFKKVIKYGSFLRIQNFLGDLWSQSQTQSIRIFESPEWVTGYNISMNYSRVSGLFLSSLNGPLLYSFSSIDYKTHYDKLMKMYNNIFFYSLFIFLIISGVLIFVSDFFISFVYGENYMIYAILTKLLLISGAVSIYGSLYIIFLRTTYRIRQQIILITIGFPVQIIFFFIGLINFGVIGMLVFDIINRIIWTVIYLILSIKVMKMNISLLKTMTLYLTFFISIFLSLILNDWLFYSINSQFWEMLNLTIFQHLNFLTILVFLGSFIGLNIIFKTFLKSDIDNIELLFVKDTISHKYIKKFLRFFRRFLR